MSTALPKQPDEPQKHPMVEETGDGINVLLPDGQYLLDKGTSIAWAHVEHNDVIKDDIILIGKNHPQDNAREFYLANGKHLFQRVIKSEQENPETIHFQQVDIQEASSKEKYYKFALVEASPYYPNENVRGDKAVLFPTGEHYFLNEGDHVLRALATKRGVRFVITNHEQMPRYVLYSTDKGFSEETSPLIITTSKKILHRIKELLPSKK